MITYAIVVTYNPEPKKIRDLIYQLEINLVKVIVVDNNSTFKDTDISYICINLDSNFGIAYAQNIGIKKAIELGAENIIFFDQDSFIDSNFVSNLLYDFDKINKTPIKLAAIGPRFLDANKGFYFPALKFNSKGLIDKISVENIDKPIEVSFLISSGTLVSVEALKEIGLMREEFFIDFVDTEWCFRALSMGYKLYMSDKAFMKHSIGDDTLKLANFNIPVHSGFRRYYRIRNLFFMWKMPYIPKILVAKLMLTNFAIQVLLFLMKDKKMDYLKYYIKATKDGIKESKNYHV